jgi:hypothetical protein
MKTVVPREKKTIFQLEFHYIAQWGANNEGSLSYVYKPATT